MAFPRPLFIVTSLLALGACEPPQGEPAPEPQTVEIQAAPTFVYTDPTPFSEPFVAASGRGDFGVATYFLPPGGGTGFILSVLELGADGTKRWRRDARASNGYVIPSLVRFDGNELYVGGTFQGSLDFGNGAIEAVMPSAFLVRFDQDGIAVVARAFGGQSARVVLIAGDRVWLTTAQSQADTLFELDLLLKPLAQRELGQRMTLVGVDATTVRLTGSVAVGAAFGDFTATVPGQHLLKLNWDLVPLELRTLTAQDGVFYAREGPVDGTIEVGLEGGWRQELTVGGDEVDPVFDVSDRGVLVAVVASGPRTEPKLVVANWTLQGEPIQRSQAPVTGPGAAMTLHQVRVLRDGTKRIALSGTFNGDWAGLHRESLSGFLAVQPEPVGP
jgi:hypothetical protein